MAYDITSVLYNYAHTHTHTQSLHGKVGNVIIATSMDGISLHSWSQTAKDEF